MSRIRIVKGKIIEIVEEHLSYFSESDIVESSAINYIENSETMINYGGNPKDPPFINGEVIEVGFAKQEVVESTNESGKKIMKLTLQNSFSMGEKVFLKVKTLGLKTKKIKVEVRQAIEKELAEKDQKIEVLSVNEMTVGKITTTEESKEKYETSNLRALENIAMKEMILEPKTDDEKKNWKDILSRTTDKKIKLYFHVEVLDAETEVKYDGDDSNDPKNFSFKKPFELTEGGNCFCNRDLTFDEVTKIIKELRDSESGTKNNYDLFSKSSSIPAQDKTYVKFTQKLNQIFNNYNVNTCIRKIHFLAQVYHETNRFRSSREEGGQTYLKSKKYYPFYGRGIMQLTWEGNKGSGHNGYKQYFDYLRRSDYKTNYGQVDSDLNLVFDSGGWFWEQGKSLSSNKPGIWKAPNFIGKVGQAVAKEGASVKKTIIKYGNDKTEYGVINLNLLADNDWVDTISWLVNGGGNGFEERRNYLKKIKEIMIYEKCINNN